MKFFPPKSTVAIDSMIFIYLFEGDKRYINFVKLLFESIENGKIKGLTSIISPIEVLSASKLEADTEKINAFSKFFYETPNFMTIDIGREIGFESAGLRRKNSSLRTPDSIQLATAIIGKAEYFVTNDVRLKNIKNLPVKIVCLEDLH